jgi:hypothetical protein
MPLEKMAVKVGTAIGCTFEAGEFNDGDAYIARFLGLHVHLYDWRGLDNRVVFILASMLDEPGYDEGPQGESVDLKIQNISPAIADLLSVRAGGDWHPPTEDEILAEREHGSRIADRFRQQEEKGAKCLRRRFRSD